MPEAPQSGMRPPGDGPSGEGQGDASQGQPRICVVPPALAVEPGPIDTVPAHGGLAPSCAHYGLSRSSEIGEAQLQVHRRSRRRRAKTVPGSPLSSSGSVGAEDRGDSSSPPPLSNPAGSEAASPAAGDVTSPANSPGAPDSSGVFERTRRRAQTGPPLWGSGASSPSLSRDKKQRRQQQQKWIEVLRAIFEQLATQEAGEGPSLQEISKEAFLQYFPLPGVLGERLFDLFDRDRSGHVDFNEFFIGLYVIYNGSPHERRRFLFDMYDLDGNGFITRSELVSLLNHIPAALDALASASLAPDAVGSSGAAETVPAAGGRPVPPDAGSTDLLAFAEYTAERLRERPRLSATAPDEAHSASDAVDQIVNDVFANSDLQAPELGISFAEFTAALARSNRLTTVLDLFYHLGMPDLPVPQNALAPDLLPTSKLQDSLSSLSLNMRRLGGKFGNRLGRHRFFTTAAGRRRISAPMHEDPDGASGPAPLARRCRSYYRYSSPSISPDEENGAGEALDSHETFSRPVSLSSSRDSSCLSSYSSSTSGSRSDPTITGSEPGESPDVERRRNRSTTATSDSKCARKSSATLLRGASRSASGHLTVEGNPPMSTSNPLPERSCAQAATSPLDPGIVLSGWLYKIGRKFNLRHRRFYVLRNRFLYYYSSETSTAPRKAMFLKNVAVSPVCQLERSPIWFGLQLVFPGGSGSDGRSRAKVKQLFTRSASERDLWIQELRKSAVASADFHSSIRLMSPRGRGRFATVHRAVDRCTQTELAVKILDKKQPFGAEFWRTEISAMRLLKHPNVVHLIGVYDVPDFLYLAMEWVPGGDLATFLKDAAKNHGNHLCSCTRTATSEIDAAAFCERLGRLVVHGAACGLSEIHRRNILHRDLKPENILMGSTHGAAAPNCSNGYGDDATQSDAEGVLRAAPPPATNNAAQSIANGLCQQCRQCGHCSFLALHKIVKIADFGLSKIMVPTGTVADALGTLVYAAPEVICAAPYSTAVDLWSLGVIMYQILNLDQLPFQGKTESEIGGEIFAFARQDSRNGDLPPLLNSCSPEAAALLHGLLRKDPSQRLTAAQVLVQPWIAAIEWPPRNASEDLRFPA